MINNGDNVEEKAVADAVELKQACQDLFMIDDGGDGTFDDGVVAHDVVTNAHDEVESIVDEKPFEQRKASGDDDHASEAT